MTGDASSPTPTVTSHSAYGLATPTLTSFDLVPIRSIPPVDLSLEVRIVISPPRRDRFLTIYARCFVERRPAPSPRGTDGIPRSTSVDVVRGTACSTVEFLRRAGYTSVWSFDKARGTTACCFVRAPYTEVYGGRAETYITAASLAAPLAASNGASVGEA